MDNVTKVMLDMGCDPSLAGFFEVHRAVCMLIDDPSLEKSVTTELYRLAVDEGSNLDRNGRYLLRKMRATPFFAERAAQVAGQFGFAPELLHTAKLKTFIKLLAWCCGPDWKEET